MTKIDEYTVENLAKSDDKAVIESAVKTLSTAFRTEADRKGRNMIAAAYATVAALRTEAASKKTLADAWDKSLSMITLYARLGMAAANLGVTQDGPIWDPSTASNKRPTTVWTLLAGNGGATISAVGQYIEKGLPTAFDANGKVTAYDGKPTQEGLLDLLTDYFDPSGVKITSKDRAKNEAKRRIALGSGEKAPTDDEKDDVPTVAGTRTNEVVFRTALHDVARLADQISTEQWNAKATQDLIAAMSKAMRDKTAFEKKQATTEEKATA